jgi:hypothetical protein
MPIGKNAIKRVENNGYSKVKTSAPDMENSHVIASPDKQVVEKLIAPVEKATAEKAAAKKACAAKKPATTAKKTAVKAATKPAAEAPVKETAKAPVKTTKKAATGSSSAKKATTQKTANKPAESKDGFVRVELGKGMPYYLL